MTAVSILKLFDAHIHFRQGRVLKELVPFTARCCNYATVMPNTDPPIQTPEDLQNYQIDVCEAQRGYPNFKPLYMAYLTPETTKKDVQAMAAAGVVGYKIYPKNKGKNGTTGSKHGIPREIFLKRPPAFQAALDEIPNQKLITSCHAEWPDTYFTHSEVEFLESDFMYDLISENHKIVIEHVCTEEGIDLIRYFSHKRGVRIAGSITLHHLHMTTDDVLGQNDNFCRPPAQSPSDLKALQKAALENDGEFFMGSDSAWHPSLSKYKAQACAGCFTSPALVERLVAFFDDHDKFPSPAFDKFVRGSACAYYGVPEPTETITLVKEEWSLDDLPLRGAIGHSEPWWGHEKVAWKLKE